jgi:hypothetical protein
MISESQKSDDHGLVVFEGEMSGMYWSDSSLGLSEKSLLKPDQLKDQNYEECLNAEYSEDSEIKWSMYPLDDSDGAVRNLKESLQSPILNKKTVHLG